MKIAVVCECSRVVASAFEAVGWDAVSIDILPAETPGNHIQADVRTLPMKFWKDIDLAICHPPCTFLSSVQNRWMHDPRYAAKRIEARAWAAFFFLWCYSLPVKKICVENPVGYMNSHFRKPDQIINPYYFCESGDPEYQKKKTCLWLSGLSLLTHPDPKTLAAPEPFYIIGEGKKKAGQKVHWVESYPYQRKCQGKPVGWTEAVHGQNMRSKTFYCIAKIMAQQWGEYVKAN